MITIAIVGAGQIGSRHLQALKSLERDCKVYVVDPNARALEMAQVRFLDMQESSNAPMVEYTLKLSDLPQFIDIAIIATSSNVRRDVLEKLISHSHIKYLVLEKVLFQKIEDYSRVDDLLNTKNIRAWVNCPTRTYAFYKTLHEKLGNSELLEINVSGSNWGLGCNAVHYLDLISYLSGTTDYSIFNDLLDRTSIPSKRDGFIEFTGTLTGYFANGARFSLSSFRNGNLPVVTQIIGSSLRYIVFENQGKALISTQEYDWGWGEEPYDSPYQSQLTNLMVGQILNTGSCDLPSFAESSKIHLPMIGSFLSHLRKYQAGRPEICKIT